MGRDLEIQVQEAHGSPNNFNPKRSSPRHITMKLSKIKDKERIFKAAKEKNSSHTRKPPNSYQQTSQQKPCRQEENGMTYAMCSKKKNCQPRILYPAKLSFRNGKTFPGKQKLREFITARPALQEMQKETLQAEMKHAN